MFDKLIENWELFVTLVVSISAFVAVFLKAPVDDSGTIYKFFYNIINYFAFNFGNATNASKQNEEAQ